MTDAFNDPPDNASDEGLSWLDPSWDDVPEHGERSRLSKSGFVYFMVSEHNICKIGESIDPQVRWRALAATRPDSHLTLVATLQVDDCLKWERYFQRPYKDQVLYLKRDWFDLSPQDILDVLREMRRVATQRGWRFTDHINLGAARLSEAEKALVIAYRLRHVRTLLDSVGDILYEISENK